MKKSHFGIAMIVFGTSVATLCINSLIKELKTAKVDKKAEKNKNVLIDLLATAHAQSLVNQLIDSGKYDGLSLDEAKATSKTDYEFAKIAFASKLTR